MKSLFSAALPLDPAKSLCASHCLLLAFPPNVIRGSVNIMTIKSRQFLIGLLGVASLVSVAACATTSDEDAANAMPDEGVTAEGEAFTCRYIQVTGTRQRERVCLSNADRDAQAERVRQGVDSTRDGNRGEARPADFGGPGR